MDRILNVKMTAGVWNPLASRDCATLSEEVELDESDSINKTRKSQSKQMMKQSWKPVGYQQLNKEPLTTQ